MYIVGAGDTANVLYFKLRDSTTGFPKTGLAYNTAGAAASYTRPLAAAVAFALASQTVAGAWVSGGFVEVDATNAPGLYRLDIPDGACAVGADYVIVALVFSGVLAEAVEIVLDPMPDVIPGTVIADSANTSLTFRTNLASNVTNFYKDAWLLFRTGALAGQVKQIRSYTGATAAITVLSAFTAAPNTNDTFVLVNR